MTQGPDRIWAKVHGASTDVISGKRGLIGGWHEHRRDGSSEYIREDLCIHGETLAEVREALERAADYIEYGHDRARPVLRHIQAALAKLYPARAQGKEG